MIRVKSFIIILLLVFAISTNYSQDINRPKLVVGIVIDQMRYDYLNKFEKYYGDTGFKRLMKDGANFTFAHYNYVPTYTGPGHASIYTGSVPNIHGIISNDWYNKKTGKFVNCVEDNSTVIIGGANKKGGSSPIQLLTTTISDQMKITTNGNCRIYSISLKDRAAILPGGHSADGVYWYDPENGKFITSSYYRNSLPGWVQDFNETNPVDKLFKEQWDLLLPDSNYTNSFPDNAPWEDDVFSEGKTSFPHSLSSVADKKYDIIRSTPFGNELLLQFAEALIENEKPGTGNYTDFLAISFSTTDFIGHAYGPNSVEIQDAFIRLDRQLGDLLTTLDNNVGKGNYILFLTADHAVSETLGFLESMHIPAGKFNHDACGDSIRKFAEREYGTSDIIRNFSNLQIYLNEKNIGKMNLTVAGVEDSFGKYLTSEFPEIQRVFLRHTMGNLSPHRIPDNYILNGFNPERSGNIEFELKPNYLPGDESYGTTHGSEYPYDTHIPLIFYGWNIPAEEINTPVFIVDVAATICNLLRITEPTGSIGIPILTR